jgi:hypothetical protein
MTSQQETQMQATAAAPVPVQLPAEQIAPAAVIEAPAPAAKASDAETLKSAIAKTEVMCDERGALMPRSLEQMFRVAKAVFQSGLSPKSFKSAEQITVAIAHGNELGLKPMQALQMLAVVNGKISIYGDAMFALGRPLLDQWAEWYEDEQGKIDESKPGWQTRTSAALKAGTLIAVCEGRRRGEVSVLRESFSIADAVRAGLMTKDGPWKQYPTRMLRWRARGYAFRALCADRFGGLLTDDEAQDIAPLTDAPSAPAAGLSGRLAAKASELEVA